MEKFEIAMQCFWELLTEKGTEYAVEWLVYNRYFIIYTIVIEIIT